MNKIIILILLNISLLGSGKFTFNCPSADEIKSKKKLKNPDKIPAILGSEINIVLKPQKLKNGSVDIKVIWTSENKFEDTQRDECSIKNRGKVLECLYSYPKYNENGEMKSKNIDRLKFSTNRMIQDDIYTRKSYTKNRVDIYFDKKLVYFNTFIMLYNQPTACENKGVWNQIKLMNR